MPSILEALPSRAQKDQLFGEMGAVFRPDALGLDGLKGLAIDNLAASFPIGDIKSFTLGTLPPLALSLSKESIHQELLQPLDRLKSINAAALLDDIARSPLAALPKPTFNINAAIGQMTTAILPTINIAPPTLEIGAFGQELLDLAGLDAPLNQLVQAGATPLRLLHIMLKTLESLVVTVGDTDKLVQFTAQSLTEIYRQGLETVDARLPLAALEKALVFCQDPTDPAGLAAQYKLLLDEIEILAAPTGTRIGKLTQAADDFVLPALRSLDQARLTLELLHANDVTALRSALARVIDMNAADSVFLQPYFDQMAQRAGQILAAVAAPVNQIRKMTQQIQHYLEQAVTTAETTAQNLAQQIEATLHQVEQLIRTVEEKIQTIQAQIESFVAKLDVSALVNKAKAGCMRIGEGVDQFFTKIEALKQKLDAVVANLGVQVDEKVTAAFLVLETKIRALLAQITAVLYREDVQRALQQARTGIENFKQAIDQASLKPVFDLVLSKTDELETSINQLNVARLSVPQRTALKVGVKILEEVKVDEIIKPELMDAFEQIRAPLAALIQLLQEKALRIEEAINLFNPGTLVSELVVNSGPYQLLIQTLEAFRPSQLLAPLQALNGLVTDVVQTLDPNKLIDEVQTLYDRLTGLLEILNPTPLNQMINDAMGRATNTLANIRDRELGNIVQTIQQTISLDKLMAGTGIQEIADADFWQLLINILGGEFLNTIKAAMDQAEAKLTARTGSLLDNHTVLRLQTTLADIDHQLLVDGPIIRKRVVELQGLLAADHFTALQTRRNRLLTRDTDGSIPSSPEVIRLLHALDLAPVLQLQPMLQTRPSA